MKDILFKEQMKCVLFRFQNNNWKNITFMITNWKYFACLFCTIYKLEEFYKNKNV